MQLLSWEVQTRIRQARISHGLTAAAFARALTGAGFPVSKSVMHYYETGRRTYLPIEYLVAASRVLGVSILALLGEEPMLERENIVLAAKVETLEKVLGQPRERRRQGK